MLGRKEKKKRKKREKREKERETEGEKEGEKEGEGRKGKEERKEGEKRPPCVCAPLCSVSASDYSRRIVLERGLNATRYVL